MKIIVTGCKGQLGTEIIKQLREGRSEIGPIPEKLLNATADFYVHLNIARYVFSRSKHFEQPRKRLALAGGGLTLRSREASQTCGAVPRSGGLCRQTAKSKVI